MGQDQPKPTAKRPTLEDSIIQMKMQTKQLERASKKAEKQGANYQKKAKEALKKNNQQGAKMYLMSAASKRNEALTCQRTALKMQFMVGNIKSMKNNQMFINSFSNLTNIASQQMGNFNFETMGNQMQVFNQKMDEMMINNKMVTEIMSTQEVGNDHIVEEMKEALQQQIAMEEKNKLMEQEKVHYEKEKKQAQNFMNDLKDL